MSLPLISVIMPSYKMGRFIEKALTSVGGQSHPNWEVIVVDDCGPDDGTMAIVHQFASQHPHQRVAFIRHSKNKGVSGARNTAMAASQGAYIAFLDPDDVWESTYLENMLKQLAQADVAACGANRIDPEDQPLGPYIYGTTESRIAQFPASLARGCFFNPSFTVIRREVYEKIGGYDEAPEIQHAEDWDYWLRALAAGFRFQFTTEAWCHYREHPTAATSNHLKMSMVCAECLRRNIKRFPKALNQELKNALYQELRNLSYMRWQRREAHWPQPIVEAICLFPVRLGAYKRMLRLFITKPRKDAQS